MSQDADTAKAVAFWLDKADAALASARAEQTAGRLDFAVNRAYYAAFYAASAAFLHRGQRFAKHTALRAAIHRDLIKSGMIDAESGRAFDRLAVSRQRADYLEFAGFDAGEVEKLIADAASFVGTMRRLNEH